jgi:threonine aldolase
MANRPYDFASDNAAGIDPKILAAVIDSNRGVASPYGADDHSERLNAVCSDSQVSSTF